MASAIQIIGKMSIPKSFEVNLERDSGSLQQNAVALVFLTGRGGLQVVTEEAVE